MCGFVLIYDPLSQQFRFIVPATTHKCAHRTAKSDVFYQRFIVKRRLYRGGDANFNQKGNVLWLQQFSPNHNIEWSDLHWGVRARPPCAVRSRPRRETHQALGLRAFAARRCRWPKLESYHPPETMYILHIPNNPSCAFALSAR